MDPQGQSPNDEQQSFQALKNKWAKQAQPTNNSVSQIRISPKAPNEDISTIAVAAAAKRVSLLTQQFEKQKIDVAVTPGNFTSSTVPQPLPPSFDEDNDPPSANESSDGDSDEDSEEDNQEQLNNKEGDNSLIEQVQKAHLKYTKLEESRFIGAPGVRNNHQVENNQQRKKPIIISSSSSSSSINKQQKKPPPLPPPSKKYHRSTIAQSVVNIPMNRLEFNPIPSIIVDTTVITSPPILPPRPPVVTITATATAIPVTPIMPLLPPRPSQSTLARAHTIASGSHSSHNNKLMVSPANIYTENSILNNTDFEDDARTTALKRANTVSVNNKRAMSRSELLMTSSIYPDFSQATRNAPQILMDQRPFSTGHKGTIYALAASKKLIITGSNLLRTWDVHTGTALNTVLMDHTSNNTNQNNDTSDRVRALVLAPSHLPIDEGRYIWAARQDTTLVVVDILGGGYKVLSKRNDVHSAAILFLLRYGNSEIWSIDENGILNVWDALAIDYQQQNPLLIAMPRRYNVTSRAVTATIYGSKLWMSSGRTLAAHAIPVAGSQVGSNDTKSQPPVRIPNDMGNITKLMTIPYHPYRIFASHDDGKISVWDTKTMDRLQVITVSMYGICTMTCVGEYHVWAGYNTGMIYVYDTRPEKWSVLKIWKAHTGAVTQLVVDETSLLLDEIKGRLQVVSSDSNGFVGVWDGLLTEHWKDDHLHQRAQEYCTYDDARIMICSWNIDANKPEKIVGEDDKAVREWLGTMEDPDVIVVGIQEIVDLESKKQTARSLFSRKKVDPTETEDVLTHRYKLWHDYLVRIIGENYGYHSYTVIKTDQLVGLFSCIFVRTTDIDRVFNVDSTSVKTGLKVMNKSIHGNKGGIAIRFVYDHSSLCFVNCHLAAGQSHVQQRNADAEGILQSASFPRHDYADVFSHGGDGSMILDHEFCFLSGDLNYRIKMTRNDVLKLLTSADKTAAWDKLQAQDQLLRQHINNPLFKLLHFEEAPIHFDPTYKYDPGTDFYDRSEKKRVPAWCDRVLYRGNRIKNLYYRRYEPRCSDHRPIGAGFSFKTKVTDQKKRDQLMAKIEEEWKGHIDRFIKDKKARYVADYERCSLNEAFGLLEKSDWDVNDTVIKLLGAI